VLYSHIPASEIETAKFEKLKVKFSWIYSNYDGIEKYVQNQYVAFKDRNPR
jgi:hypothetical protein